MRRHGLRRRRRILRLRRGVFLLPSLLTTANIFCGFISIVWTFQLEFQKAALFIILAGVLDGLDGRIARLMKATTEFGGEFDSLADVVSFGLAPAFLLNVWGLTPLARYGWIVAFLFLICGAVRLARFNIQHGATDRRWFVGLPIPMAATVVAGSVLLFEDRIDNPKLSIGFAALVLLTSFMMVSKVRYRSFKDIGLRSSHPFRTVISIAFALALATIHPTLALAACAYLYLLLGPLVSALNLRRSATNAAQGGTQPEETREEAPSGAR